ncbi:class I SAM-dependent methyltransferase [Congregibacter brevis]|uniref:Class I SAM-dependent methyltransferase n=1 Tax=Congregibacter brevis TaxID=3081201 RepID=A0ABZ0IBQ2_9GAMM|nr:class I SAM-dependent methyltransferase [Congregibacter sp. IMCC45268]
MKLINRLSFLALAFAAASACSADQPTEVVENGFYEYKSATRDGIGKFYMDREISYVMGHMGAGWLERPERERQERTDLLIDRLPVDPDSVVADIGAGTGYFTFPIAARVPDGQVYAVDIQPEMLQLLSERQSELSVENVTTVLGTETSPNLPTNTIDLAFIVDAYHEFSYPREMGMALAEALKPGGKLVLIEYRSEDLSIPIKTLHKMSEEQVRLEMQAIGLDWVVTEDYLPQQHVLIFEKPAVAAE